METKARTSENMPLMFRRRKKGKIKAVATGVFFMAAVFLFFAGQVLGDENGMVIQTTKGQDMVSPEVYATLEGVQQVKEKQQRYIENINKSQNGEDDNLIYRHNLDGSFSITDKKEGMFSLFDKTGKAISCVDVKTGEKIEFNTEGKIEAVEEADGSRTEYLYDKEGEVLDVLKYDKDGKTKDESEEITERIDVAKETKALLQKEEKKETLVIKGENAGIANLEAEENIIEKVLSVIEELSIFAKDAFIKVSSWLQTQIDNVINCAVKALENIIGFQSPHAYRQAGVTSHQSIEELAQETLLADILGGVIDENTRGKLETSMYAIKEAALQNGIELSGIKVDYNQLFDFYHSPFTIHYSPYIICHLSAGHYIVVTNVAENGVSYIDSEGNENTISKEVFIGAWSGNVLLPLSWLSGERGKELTDEELKSIKGSGTTYNCNFDDGTSPGENGFTVGATGEGSVIVEEDAEHGGYSAKLWGNESHDSVVSMEKIFILEEAGEVNFYWKVSSEEDYDYLKFYIDDVEQVKISGEVDWESRSYDLSAGEHILKWMYEKDGSDSEGSDAGWIDDINVTGNAAEEELVSDDVIVETGDYIGVKYTGYLEDGSVFDSNEDSEDFLYFTVGSGEMIEGFDESVIGLLLGEKITVTIPPEKAYGLEGEHELAGKTLIFDIQVMEINDQQTAETVEEFYFDDGVSPEGNGFTVEATGDGDVLLEEDGATGYSVKIWGNDSHDSVTSMEKVFILG
ncbi:MAG: FKBP-type peptidyl-prolyl cis-trans isomerase, partial [Candidatus Omnitrophota bacterium]